MVFFRGRCISGIDFKVPIFEGIRLLFTEFHDLLRAPNTEIKEFLEGTKS
jgi:hypothetical protein